MRLLSSMIPAACVAAAAAAAAPRRPWTDWHPERLKAPVDVHISGNPLQPGAEHASRSAAEGPALAPGLEKQLAALRAALRGVIRDPQRPVLLLGSRLVFCGDELPVAREAALSLRLKSIGPDHLVVLVVAADGRPGGAREMLVPLDPYWRSR